MRINWKKLRKSGDYMAVYTEFWRFYPKLCLACGSKDNLEVDHIKPISKNPWLALDINNMQPLCKVCNKGKSNRNEIDYRDSDDKESIQELYELKTWLHYMRQRWRKYLNN